MKTLLLLVLAVFVSTGHCQEAGNCCQSVSLESTGGIADLYPRYVGVWEMMGLYDGKPFYMCIADCQGLDNQLLYTDGLWQVVDCRPEDTVACNGMHAYIESSDASEDSCPDNSDLTWYYCDGDLILGGGCTKYSSDGTARFACQSR